jgi:hypothetical protein
VKIRAIRGSNLFIRNPMSFTIFNTVKQMILAAATSLDSGAGGSFLPRISRMSTNGRPPSHFLIRENSCHSWFQSLHPKPHELHHFQHRQADDPRRRDQPWQRRERFLFITNFMNFTNEHEWKTSKPFSYS